MLHRACSFEIQRSWIEMNSTMLRTKLLNDKSSNIYKITKCFHSGSVSVPRGKPVWGWSTGQALCQGLHCTGTSPLHPGTVPWGKGHPCKGDRGGSGALRAHGADHQFWECSSFCPLPTAEVHSALGAGDSPCCTNSPRVGREDLHLFLSKSLSDFVSLLSGPTWYCLDIVPHLVWLCTSNARRNLVCANPLCTSPPFPAPQREPAASPSPQIPGLCTTISLCTEEQWKWQNLTLQRWCRHKIHCAWTVRHRDIFFCLEGQHIDFYPVQMRGTEGRQLPVSGPGAARSKATEMLGVLFRGGKPSWSCRSTGWQTGAEQGLWAHERMGCCAMGWF